MDTNTKIALGVVLVGGVGLALYLRSRSAVPVVGVPFVPVAKPSILDMILQGVTQVGVASATKALDKGVAASAAATAAAKDGPARVKAYNIALKNGLPYYDYAGKCYSTSTGIQTTSNYCPVLELKGY